MTQPILRPGIKYERKIRKAVYKNLRSQFSYLKKHLEEIYAKPVLRVGYRGKSFDNLNDFFTKMGIYSIEDDIYQDIKAMLISGYRGRSKINKQDLNNFGIEFNKNNPAITSYMDAFSKLQLSDFKGSIAGTTKRAIISMLQDGFKNGTSYTEIAKNINTLDNTLFSMYRARMIAINETGKAFEYGNALPMYEIQQQGGVVEKLRVTMGDGKVTPTHQENEDEGRVPFDFVYGATGGDDMPPASDNPNCRCHEQYRVL